MTWQRRLSVWLSCFFLCIIRGPARGIHLSLSLADSQSRTLNFKSSTKTEHHSFLFSISLFPPKIFKKKKKTQALISVIPQNPNFFSIFLPKFLLPYKPLNPLETLLIRFFFFHLLSWLLFSFTNIVLQNKQNPITTYTYFVSRVHNFSTKERKIGFRTVLSLSPCGYV